MRTSAGREGFTFLELVIVLGIIGVLFAISVPSFHGFMPKYRLRSAGRQVGMALEQVRLSAMTRGLWMGVHYTFSPPDHPDTSHYQVIPPPPEDFPDQPVADRQLMDPDRLPDGVRIARVILANNHIVDRGSLSVLFSPMGNAGSHIVVLEGPDERLFSLKLNCITGTVEFVEGGEPTFQHYQE